MAIVLEDTGEAKEKAILSREGSRISGRELIDRKLHAAQEILAEVFRVRLSEVDEMIQNRPEDKSWREEIGWPDEEGLWPESFCVGD